jgi:hypothetical protein
MLELSVDEAEDDCEDVVLDADSIDEVGGMLELSVDEAEDDCEDVVLVADMVDKVDCEPDGSGVPSGQTGKPSPESTQTWSESNPANKSP